MICCSHQWTCYSILCYFTLSERLLFFIFHCLVVLFVNALLRMCVNGLLVWINFLVCFPSYVCLLVWIGKSLGESICAFL